MSVMLILLITLFGNFHCQNICELASTQAACPTSGSIICSTTNNCSWNGSVCIDNGCSHGTDCMYGQSSCTNTGCAWNAILGVCLYVGGTYDCMSASTSCPVCPSQRLCFAKSYICYWDNDECKNSTTTPTCNAGSPCSSCMTEYECQNTGIDCEWHSNSMQCVHAQHCLGAAGDCSTCTEVGDCYNKGSSCYWDGACFNSSASATCSTSSACPECKSELDCTSRSAGCMWNSATHTCNELNCEIYTTQQTCPTTGSIACGVTNRCSWNSSVCIDNGCIHNSDCMYTQSSCTRTGCSWNAYLGVCLYTAGSISTCMSFSSECTVCPTERLCTAKDSQCYWSTTSTANGCRNVTVNPTCTAASSCSQCGSAYECNNIVANCQWHQNTGTCVHQDHCLSSTSTCSACSSLTECYDKAAACYWVDGSGCLNSSVTATCPTTGMCSSCKSASECGANSEGCVWNSTTRTCGAWDCEIYLTQATCPTTGSIACGTTNRCSWNSSVCIDNGCIHNSDCMYSQGSCTRTGCQWNAYLGVCLYTAGSSTCMSSSTTCSACRSPRLCYAKNAACYWNNVTSQCSNSTTSPSCNPGSTASDPGECGSCRSTAECSAGSGCVWHADGLYCIHELHCLSPSSTCAQCSNDECYLKNAYCYLNATTNLCQNSSATATCTSQSECSACLSDYDCNNRGSGCMWNAATFTCSPWNCEQFSTQATCPTASYSYCATNNRCSWNASVCIDNGCIHNNLNCILSQAACGVTAGCSWNTELGICIYSGGNSNCLASSTSCSVCLTQQFCYAKAPVCYWNNGVCTNSTQSATCSGSAGQCSACKSAYDCMVIGPGCEWSSATHTCSASTQGCTGSSSSCKTCSTADTCYGKDPACYYASGSCQNSSYVSTCPAGSGCSTCLSAYDCSSRRGMECAWNAATRTCSVLPCSSGLSGCPACNSSASDCWAKNQYCYFDTSGGGTCISSSASPTCSSSDACSLCRSSYDCLSRGNGCMWNADTKTCGAWDCEQYTTRETCPTTGSVVCATNNRCSWNSSVCVDNGCIHSSDCMYSQTSCTRSGCSWNAYLQVCLYTGGSSTCLGSTTDCSLCTSERLCYAKDPICYWSSGSACINSSTTPACTASQPCSDCQSIYECNNHEDCEYHSGSHSCVHITHCLAAAGDCSTCDIADCYAKSQYCYVSDTSTSTQVCYNSSSVGTCTASSQCSQCLSQYDCTSRGEGCLWDGTSNTCDSLNCEQYTTSDACPSTGSIICSSATGCSWNNSVCVDNGCYHGTDCMYGQSSCASRPNCAWNPVIQVCVYSGGSNNCLSSSSDCSVCTNEALCYAKNDVCFWEPLESGAVCANASGRPTCSATDDCGLCLSKAGCNGRADCSWHPSAHVCVHEQHCMSPTSDCSACDPASGNTADECFAKDPVCYWNSSLTVLPCVNSSTAATCSTSSPCTNCKSQFDCQSRSSGCIWDVSTNLCTELNCEQFSTQATCPTTGSISCGATNRCSWNASVCIDNGCLHSSDCMYGQSSCTRPGCSWHSLLGICLYAAGSTSCVNPDTACDVCLNSRLCYMKSNACYWNNGACVNTTTVGTCTSTSACSTCLSSYDCMVRGTGCQWNSNTNLCSTGTCTASASSCSACNGQTEAICYGKNAACYWNSASSTCINSTGSSTCPAGTTSCSQCLSAYDCSNARGGECVWTTATRTCAALSCTAAGAGCGACSNTNADTCYGKNSLCYYENNICINTSLAASATCSRSTPCSSCKSSYDCTNRGDGCMWNPTTRTCGAWNCEQYSTQSTCPTDGSVLCGTNNRCSWNASVCVDNGCIHSSDCMYTQSGCTQSGCGWNSVLQICLYVGGSSNCMSTTTDCSVCGSENFCHIKSNMCYWNNGQCYNSSTTPSCTGGSTECSACKSLYECDFMRTDCFWHDDSHNCVHEQHCLSSTQDCPQCFSSSECYAKGSTCYWGSTGCLNSSTTGTCNSFSPCSSCLSSYDCTNRGDGCVWNSTTNTCNTWNCEQYTTAATCPTNTYNYCAVNNRCSWNSSVCIDNGCIHGKDCMYSQTSCNPNNNCTWNTELAICVYSGGGSNCMSLSTSCSACTSERLCWSKNAACYWSGGACLNATAGTPSCTATSGCPACTSAYDCMVRGPGCQWNTASHTCSQAACASTSSSCAACTASGETSCWAKNNACYWDAGTCKNSSLDSTCPSTTACSTCKSAYDCSVVRGSQCQWSAASRQCSALTCSSAASGCAACSESSTACYGKNEYCYYQSGACINSSATASCSLADACSVCRSPYDCTNRGSGCVWNATSIACIPLNCEQYSTQATCPTSNTIYCATNNRCSWNSSVCVDNGCSHSTDCMYPQSSCSGSCGWNAYLAVCVYVGGTTNCMATATSCSACTSARLCNAKNEVCYWNTASGQCLNSSSSPTCSSTGQCSNCRSAYDCNTVFTDCEWHPELLQCVHEAHCTSPTSACSACGDSESCWTKDPACYWTSSNQCQNTSGAVGTCSASSACSSCLSQYDCTTRGDGCMWNLASRTCSQWNCEQYTTQSSCPTTGTIYCSTDNRCSWNSSVCIDNGCIHNSDCMYVQSSCTRTGCGWNAYLQVCLWQGGSSNCMSTNSECNSCGSERLCNAKSSVCYWNGNGNTCVNSSSNPTCNVNSQCSQCLSSFDCTNSGSNCEWHANSGTCVHSTHCLSTTGGCNNCDNPADCYNKDDNCYWNTNNLCTNSSLLATCTTASACSACKSATDCRSRSAGCIWDSITRTCGDLNCERFTDRTTCPTTGAIYCSDTNSCSWNGSVCIDNGCLHGTDCMYAQSSCASQSNCVWRNLLGVCVYSGGSTNCMSLSTSCSACTSATLCTGKDNACSWSNGICVNTTDNACTQGTQCSACSSFGANDCFGKNPSCYYSGSTCYNSSSTPTCSGSASCTSCGSASECQNRGCTWNSANRVCTQSVSCQTSTSCSSCNASISECYGKNSVCFFELLANGTQLCWNATEIGVCNSATSICAACNSQLGCNNHGGCTWSTSSYACSETPTCANTPGCTACNNDQSGCYSKDTLVCYYNPSSGLCQNATTTASCNAASPCSECLSMYECITLNTQRDCSWSGGSRTCSYSGGGSSCSPSTACSSCTSQGDCSNHGGCSWISNSCSETLQCSDSRSDCSACSASSSVCYAKNSLCYYQGGTCYNSSTNPSCSSTTPCSACLTSSDCLTIIGSCGWNSSGIDAYNTSCHAQANASTCISNPQTCLEQITGDMARSQAAGVIFSALLNITSQTLNLPSNTLNITYGNLNISGQNQAQSAINVGIYQITFNTSGNLNVSNVALTRTTSASSLSILSISSGNFLIVSVTINSSGSGQSNTRMSNAGSVDNCARKSNNVAVSLYRATGTFKNTVFSNLDSGAIYVNGGNSITFDNTEFRGNSLAQYGVGYRNLRHNAYFEGNSQVTVMQVISDVVSSDGVPQLFFTTPENDQSRFYTSGISLLYSVTADVFIIEESNGQRIGRFTGDFVPCGFTVKMNYDGLGPSGVTLPLFVDSETTAHFEFPAGVNLSASGEYRFQFIYKVGTSTGTTPDVTFRFGGTTDNNGSGGGDNNDNNGGDTKSQSSGNGGIIAAIIIPIVVVIVGVVVVVLVLIIVRKKREDPATAAKAASNKKRLRGGGQGEEDGDREMDGMESAVVRLEVSEDNSVIDKTGASIEDQIEEEIEEEKDSFDEM